MATPDKSTNSEGRSSAQPNPELFWHTILGYQRSAALRAALEIDLFTAIGTGYRTPARLSQECSTSERGFRILCDYLTVIGFLQKESGEYFLTPDTATFLDKRSSSYLGSTVDFFHSPDLMSAFDDFPGVVRSGTTLLEGAGVVDPEDPVWVRFAQAMPPLFYGAADFVGQWVHENVKGRIRVLDIAAGHGLFGISIGSKHAEAEIVALDWPNVLEVASENAASAGIQDRFSTIAGDAFDVEFGCDYDVVLITNLFHHFDLATCSRLAHKVARSLKPGGKALTLEFVPDEDHISPTIPATFSLMMLATTPSGNAHTFDEYAALFKEAGFDRSELLQVSGSPQQLIVSYR